MDRYGNSIPFRRTPMPTPSKGPRRHYKCRVPVDVDVERLARHGGCSSVSQFLADIICREAGRPDLVRELQEVLPLTA